MSSLTLRLQTLKFKAAMGLETITMFPRVVLYWVYTAIYFALQLDPKRRHVFSGFVSSRAGMARPCPYADSRDVYTFKAPGPKDSRAPCPALNAMANHGYLPRNGRNISGSDLTSALIKCYNLSWPLAAFLAWGGVLMLGQAGLLSLGDLARHDRVEHDASITHVNTPEEDEYAPTEHNEELYQAFLADARDGHFTAEDIARARVRREAEADNVLTNTQKEVGRGEVALVLQIFGGENFAVPVKFIETWWRQERLPTGWKPTRQTTLLDTIKWAGIIRDHMFKMQAAPATTPVAFVTPRKTTDVINEHVEEHISRSSSPQQSSSGSLSPSPSSTFAELPSVPVTPSASPTSSGFRFRKNAVEAIDEPSVVFTVTA